ncbi:MAG: FAD-dependent monooxygenase [Streptosporangiaceae bacterium]|jgi:2-polyprenyl-6-methoxyphenol hydroxylase-like FAD-dependent oxidoreductase
MAEPDVIVVGGGIGGLSAAFALSRQEPRVRVLERASEFGEVGAGIQLAPNCTRILHEYGLLEEAVALGVLPRTMVMRDALDGSDLTHLDLTDLERRYGFPYLVIHRTDLHAVLLRACQRAGVELRTSQHVTGYSSAGAVSLADGSTQRAGVVIAADGLHSVARGQLAGDDLVGSAYVAFRGAIPAGTARESGVTENDVVVYVGPRCHFVRYPLRGGEILNQVAVFRSPSGSGTPGELDAAFAGACETVRQGITLMGRDRWWGMSDRDPIGSWVNGRVALLGDAAHPPLQYIAQGAIMAIEDGWVLASHAGLLGQDWDAVLSAYQAVRAEHCRRVVLASRDWGYLWHLDGDKRLLRNEMLRARDTYDYGFVDWLYGSTALTPEQEPPRYPAITLAVAHGHVASKGCGNLPGWVSQLGDRRSSRSRRTELRSASTSRIRGSEYQPPPTGRLPMSEMTRFAGCGSPVSFAWPLTWTSRRLIPVMPICGCICSRTGWCVPTR